VCLATMPTSHLQRIARNFNTLRPARLPAPTLPYAAEYKAPLLDSYDTFTVAMTWLPLLAAGLATLVLKNLPRDWGKARATARGACIWLT